MLKKGDQLPDISLPNQNGDTVSLTEFTGEKNLVIYFYPKNNTKVCTAQACSFRDSYEEFQDLGAEVIGISLDSVDSHASVATDRSLPFILLSDPKKSAMKAFGVPVRFGLLTKRITFVINKEGKIIHTFHSEFFAQKHVDEAIKILKAQG
ncbi:MAG: peroxiredoxin [Ekhidna sp.]